MSDAPPPPPPEALLIVQAGGGLVLFDAAVLDDGTLASDLPISAALSVHESADSLRFAVEAWHCALSDGERDAKAVTP